MYDPDQNLILEQQYRFDGETNYSNLLNIIPKPALDILLQGKIIFRQHA